MPVWNPAKSLARGKPDGSSAETAKAAKKTEKPHKPNPNAKPISNQVRRDNND